MTANINNELPRTRADAIEIGSKKYFTGLPCKYGHISERSTNDKICQECNRERARQFAKNFPEKKREQSKARYWLDVEVSRKAARDYSQKNAEAARQRAKEWREKNPERAAHNDRTKRARKRNARGSHTADDVSNLLHRQRFRCVYCNTSIRRKEARHVDHIMPLKLGGANDISNIQILCARCNMSKKASHPIDYANRIGLLV